jgi:hypothetical protein
MQLRIGEHIEIEIHRGGCLLDWEHSRGSTTGSDCRATERDL